MRGKEIIIETLCLSCISNCLMNYKFSWSVSIHKCIYRSLCEKFQNEYDYYKSDGCDKDCKSKCCFLKSKRLTVIVTEKVLILNKSCPL